MTSGRLPAYGRRVLRRARPAAVGGEERIVIPQAPQAALTLEAVIDAIQAVLRGQQSGTVQLTGDTRLEDLDLDSLDGAELFVRLEEAAGVPLDPGSAAEMKTVAELTALRPAST